MTHEQMWALIQRHMQAEVRQDYPEIFDTLIPEPFYEIHPLGLLVKGAEAVGVMYRRLLPGIFPHVVESEAFTFGTQHSQGNVWFADSSVAIRESAICQVPDLGRIVISEIAVFRFQGELLEGETFYCNGPLTSLFKHALGADFEGLPGVSKLY